MRLTEAEFAKLQSRATGKPLREIAEDAIAGVFKPSGAFLATDAGVGMRFVIYQQPIGKPRMTRRDKWAKLPVVISYHQWADKAREQVRHITLPSEPISLSIRAYFAIPQSWSKRKRMQMVGQPHRQKPDWDNIAKAIQDIFWEKDQMVAFGHVEKFWDDGNGARVEIEVR